MKIYKHRLSDFSDSDYNFWYGLLHENKKKRVDSYRNTDDKRRSVCAHMLALKGISEHSGMRVEEIILTEDKNGKPLCKNAEVHFSISHADNMVVCAIHHQPVGIDIEKLRPVKLSAARRICTEKELEYIFGHSPSDADFSKNDEDLLTRFFEIWVKKEAFGKKEGTGIAYNMKETDLMHIPCFYEDGYVYAVC